MEAPAFWSNLIEHICKGGGAQDLFINSFCLFVFVLAMALHCWVLTKTASDWKVILIATQMMRHNSKFPKIVTMNPTLDLILD